MSTAGCAPLAGWMNAASHVPSGVFTCTSVSTTDSAADADPAATASPAATDIVTNSRRDTSFGVSFGSSSCFLSAIVVSSSAFHVALERHLDRKLNLPRISDAGSEEPVEVEQRRRRERVDVVRVVERVEHLEARHDVDAHADAERTLEPPVE